MQTRQEVGLACSPLAVRLVSAIAALAATLSLSSCASPRFAGRAESEQTLSACESAYYAAADSSAMAAPGSNWPAIMRYLSARSAASQWIEVAAQCTDRFSEGVLRAAQSQYAAAVLGERLGLGDGASQSDNDGQADDASESHATEGGSDDSGTFTVTPEDVTSTSASAEHDLTGVAALDVTPTALASMALAEDRAGFVAEILTARGDDAHATLKLSAMHKSAGERLISLSRVEATADPRQKAYDISQLTAHPDRIVDPATGLTAPTLAVAEINCAREELDALSPAGQTTQSSDTTNDSGESSGTAATTNEAREESESLRILARFVSSRVARAFSYGYPTFDQALFS
ncbi:hypothetical protein KIH79_06905 [Bifidobacterium sp. 82T10]|uniref:Lipoprotein n=1 Tax=Bifidobacterium miconis TaxID=2834435 RepID=A0ABS6WF52_9BIFI|nr:hypothetical protein [Bifidobacterium miconis]MBW3092679.1 hypothetical protein [Bifidobacterium miconis]